MKTCVFVKNKSKQKKKNISKQICCEILMWVDNRGLTFSQQEALFWIMDFYLSFLVFLKSHMLFTSQVISWWMVWITCGLLWCFYQLFGLWFWRHPFTTWCNYISPNLFWWRTNSSTSWMAWKVQQIVIWGELWKTVKAKNIKSN